MYGFTNPQDPEHNPQDPLQQAVSDLLTAKATEDGAKHKRLAAEEALLRLIQQENTPKEEGSVKVEIGAHKVTVSYSITRKVTEESLKEVANDVPPEFQKRVIRWKPEVSVTELRYLQNNEPAVFAALARAIEAKPAKPSIKIEAVKQKEAA